MSNTNEPIQPCPSVADALRLFHSLKLPTSSVNMQPLDDETLEALGRVEGYANPLDLATQLSAGLHVLWVARKSGELADDHVDSTLWLLAEVSSLLEHTIEVQHEAIYWRNQHEKTLASAEQNKPAQRRRGRKEVGK